MRKIALSLLLVFSISLTLLGQNSESIVYDYVIIIAQPKLVLLSFSNGTYEEKKISSKGADYTGVLRIITELEDKGYEMYANEFQILGVTTNLFRNYFLMRKKKN